VFYKEIIVMLLNESYKNIQTQIDKCLIEFLSKKSIPEELLSAIKYIFIGNGKKMRSLLLIETSKIFNVKYDDAIKIALALECLHTYSLIHDDLPAMDNDDFRRGKKTLHRKYSESTAILTGDALLTLAFEILVSGDIAFSDKIKLKLVNNLAFASGLEGMVAGQILDIDFEEKDIELDRIKYMQSLKTGALFNFACIAGVIMGGGNENDLERLQIFAKAFGLVFQITDDIIDINSDFINSGKTVSKDNVVGKATISNKLGSDQARVEAIKYINMATKSLNFYGTRGESLIHICENLLDRKK